eukprot:914789-Pleurochrysis_carterae.AAC.1
MFLAGQPNLRVRGPARVRMHGLACERLRERESACACACAQSLRLRERVCACAAVRFCAPARSLHAYACVHAPSRRRHSHLSNCISHSAHLLQFEPIPSFRASSSPLPFRPVITCHQPLSCSANQPPSCPAV